MHYAFAHQLAEVRERGKGATASFLIRSFLHALGFGLLERIKTLATLDTLRMDLLLALRRLRKSPRFTLVALLTLALGIGANSALFSVVHSVLLSSLPFEDSEELVFAFETRQEGSTIAGVSPLNFREWREAGTGLGELAALSRMPFNVTGTETPVRITGLQVSPGILSLLRVSPHLGREFTTDEEHPDAEPVCMVSHAFWRDRLGGNRDLASASLILNGESHTVVGVLPEGFQLPGFGSNPILTPLPLDPSQPGFWSNHNTVVFGRLGDGVSLERANGEVAAIATRLEEAYPDWNEGIGARLVPARSQIVQGAQRTLWILFGAVGFVLVIACANIASLLLARATEAEREMAVRTALGAHTSRIVRLVLSEALLLSAAGGLLGLWVCHLGIDAIQAWAPGNIPRLGEVSVSAQVLGFTLAVSLGTGLLFGLLPALHASRVNIDSVLKDGGRTAGLGGRRHRAQRLFVVGEVALSVVLLVGSGLLLRTFGNLLGVEPGFEIQGRVAMHVSLPQASYQDRSAVTAFLTRLHEELDATPGVQVSGSSVGLPFQGLMWRKLMTLEDRPAATRPEVPVVDLSIVTPDYLDALGIPLRRGRALLESDSPEGPYPALVNEAFVRAHLPDEDPLGRRLRLGPPDHLLPAEGATGLPWYTIVGVVGEVRRWNLGADPIPEVFIHQRHDMDMAREFFVVARTSLPPADLSDGMRQAVWNVDPDQPVAWVQPMATMYSNMVAQPRFNAALVAAFGVTALILALIGVYGLMSNAVTARTQEIGLRIALGARPRQLLKHVAGQGVLASLAGIGIGIVAALALTRLMESLLFGIEPLDPTTYLIVMISVLLVASAAASVPSWRATKLDPTVALREE